MKKIVIFILGISIFVLLFNVFYSKRNNHSTQLDAVCYENGFNVKLYAKGSNGDNIYRAQNEETDIIINLICEDENVRVIEIEKEIYSIDDKLKYSDELFNLITELANHYGSKTYHISDFKYFLYNNDKDEKVNVVDMIFEKIEDNQYYCLMCIDSYAKNYNEGDPLLERYVISID